MKKQIIILCLLLLSVIGNLQAQEPFIGEIRMFAGNFAPRGWAFCDGQLLPISQNQALFSILGTTYGGDGRTTFGLPELRGRFAMHAGNGPGLTPRPQGQRSGSENHTLTSNNLPPHSHVVAIPSAQVGDTDIPNGNILSGNSINGFKANSDGTLATFNTGSSGNNAAVNHVPPFTTVRYIICLQGVFPSRN
ncbi:phage tail protein [Hanstruepera ponticola]|uniref:phage tail protein n=1 Tax=Hanstruepera ponticola TaxID=2042995 RepID=UPI00177DA237|nr:tail fiber protein [Hanstruepera ponticola]